MSDSASRLKSEAFEEKSARVNVRSDRVKDVTEAANGLRHRPPRASTRPRGAGRVWCPYDGVAAGGGARDPAVAGRIRP